MQVLALLARPFVVLLTVSTYALLRLMGIKQSSVTEEDKGRYLTISGMIMPLLDRVPRTGKHVDWAG